MAEPSIAKKTAMRAAFANGNVAAAIAAGVASVATANPLPLILYGLGSGLWVLRCTQSPTYRQRVLMEERVAAAAAAATARKAHRDRIAAQCTEEPLRTWVGGADFPEYLTRYDELVEAHDRILALLRERHTEAGSTADDLEQQLEDLLNAYLRLVDSRILIARVLTGAYRAKAPRPRSRRPEFVPRELWRVLVDEGEVDDARDECVDDTGRSPRHRRQHVIDFDRQKRINELDWQIADLRGQMEQQPRLRDALAPLLKLAEQQRASMAQCLDRDERIALQLETYPRMFDLLYTRLSLAQPTAGDVLYTEITEFADGVQATERSVAEIQRLVGAFEAQHGLTA
ncbi:hypothetical protein HYV74_04275 [Candidatus Uhrbacteria bacterium]|nr:hypothetical protein [Candidatus Uhrbacteria bacterium]